MDVGNWFCYIPRNPGNGNGFGDEGWLSSSKEKCKLSKSKNVMYGGVF